MSVTDSRAVTGDFIFDTGAGLDLLLPENFVNDSTLFKKKRKYYPTQAEGIGGKETMQLSIIKQVHLGPYTFRQVPVYVFKDEYNVTSYPLYSGIIGNDLLRRFNLIVNYSENSIYLKPNKHYLDSFNYSYTGLSIYEIDSIVKVIDIIPNSPGDKAGFKKGDVIFGVDTYILKNIQAIKMVLQNADTTVTVFIRRGDKLMELRLRIKNIRY